MEKKSDQVFFIKQNVFCLSLLVTIPKRDRVHGWQSLQPDYWLVPSRLLSFVSGHGTIAGDYYGIWCEGDDGKMKGGKEETLLFPPSHHPSRFSWPRFSRRRRRRRQRERQKSNRFSKQNNNFARVSHFFVHLAAITSRLRGGNA